MPRQGLINITTSSTSRSFFILLVLLLSTVSGDAKVFKEKLKTRAGDEIEVRYDMTESDGEVALTFQTPRVSLATYGSKLKEDFKGNAGNIKVVLFEKKFIPDKTKFEGGFDTYSVPVGLKKVSDNPDGYYIFGESPSLEFSRNKAGPVDIVLPLYVAIYKSKGKYKVYEQLTPSLVIKTGMRHSTGGQKDSEGPAENITTRTSLKYIEETVEVEDGENDIILQISDCMNTIRKLLSQQTESPFSPILTGEIQKLQTLSSQVKDKEVRERIAELMVECNERDLELKENAKAEARTAAEKDKAEMKAEAEEQKKEAEQQALIQEEKQKKRTLWMIIGGALLAVVAFVGNAVFRHFRDIRNQKSVQAMQDSIMRQAQGEATRRSREVIRNKAHQMVNKGKNKMRQAATDAAARRKDKISGTEGRSSGPAKINKEDKNSKIKSI